MTSEFSVNLEQLDQVVSQLGKLADFLRNHLDELDQKAESLTGGSWESAAASAYTEAHNQWSTSAKEFADGVADTSEAARLAHSSYTTVISLNSISKS
ncbi:WXG100 family type VII secretion target [Nocardia sp. ET3-3]|uniref:ESAT-6-like protein n=1 Tax=Nocardia terrae TaxID=2675851 RepID=A0A7K1V3P2_9NOCA|nr:WXG100 family type VII secretion target [Nocardia terrae]MVU81112.1 WXG100 family type VII secretion target [Nocardia terrae]